MTKTRLSKSAINNLNYSGKVKDHYDLGCKGLLVRVGKNSKTFYIYLNRGMHKLGSFCARNKHGIDLDTARAEAINFRNLNATAQTGFKNVTFLYYLENQYQKDAIGLGKTVSDATVSTIKRQFKHCHSKLCHKITDDDFVEFVFNNPHLKENSVRKAYYALSGLLNTLVKKKRISLNPLEPRSLNADSERPINTYSIDRAEIIKDLLNDDFGKKSKYSRGFSKETRLITALAIDGGYRPSEIYRNTKDCFILDEEPRTQVFSEICKTSKPRVVPIFSIYLSNAMQDYLKNGYIENQKKYMFYNKTTKSHFASSCYRSVWKVIKEKYGLAGRFYDFRHTFATDAYKATGDIKLVADLIGDNIETASKYYAQTNISSARSRLESIL